MNRFKAIREKMLSMELDAMLITGEINRQYATGFHSTAGVCLVTTEKNYFFTDSRYIEAASKSITDAEICQVKTQGRYSDLVGNVLAGCSRVGFEQQTMCVEEFNRWQQKLNCELVPAQELFTQLRMAKSSEEIEIMLQAQQITDEACTDVLEFIKEGQTELEIAAFLQYSMLKRGARGMSFDPIVVSGPNSSMPHGVPSERKVQAGDFITMDFGCIYKGYCSDMTRTVALGYVTGEMRRVYQLVLDAQQAGISAFRAGIKGKEVDAAARKVISDGGYGEYFGHGFGHSLGMEIHENPNANTAEEKPLPVGAVISAEPGIYLPGKFGVRIEDVVVVEDDGCRDITKSPKNLIIL